jgi:hypothetical protein
LPYSLTGNLVLVAYLLKGLAAAEEYRHLPCACSPVFGLFDLVHILDKHTRVAAVVKWV